MANGLNFSAVLKLQKQNFDRGIKDVQRSLNALKTTFMQVAGALGAGLGLSALVSNMRTTATQLSVVKATLENVSEGIIEYQENLEFLEKIANKYGQSQVALTGSFAKFKSAAQGAGMSLEEVRRIFEAVTRASGAFHLSAEQTQSVMVALEQMASKGKVMSEELRRQLANNLPGAFAMMADAAGRAGITLNGTTGELEQAMKQGRVTADVLKYFAEVLNETTQDANFDSLQSSLNRFQNSWNHFVEASGFEKTFQNLVDSGTKALDILANNFVAFRHTVVDLGVLIAGGIGFSKFQERGKKALATLHKDFDTLEAKIVQTATEQVKLQTSLEAIGTAKYLDMVSAKMSEEWLLEKGINEELVQEILYLESIEKHAGARIVAGLEYVKTQEKINAKQVEFNELNRQSVAVGKKLTAEGNAARTAYLGLATAVKSVANAIKGVLAAVGWGILFSVISEIVQLTIDWVRNLLKVDKTITDIVGEAKKIDEATARQLTEAEEYGRQYAQVLKKYEEQKKIGKDLTELEKQKETLINNVNKTLGLTGDKMLTVKSTAGDVNEAISQWSEKIKIAAQQMAVMDKMTELTKRKLDAQMELETIKANPDRGKTTTRTVVPAGGGGAITWEQMTRDAKILDDREKQLEADIKRIDEDQQKLQDAADKLAAAAIDAANGSDIEGSVGAEVKKTAKTVKDAIDEYRTEVQKLENQHKRGALTEEDYSKSLKKTVKNTWETLAGFTDLEHQLAGLEADYRKTAAGIQEAFEELKLADAFDEAFKDLEDSFKKLDDETEEHLKKLAENDRKAIELLTKETPQAKKRDTFFDYKKSSSTVLGEQVAIAEENLERLRDEKQELEDLKNEIGASFTAELQARLEAINDQLIAAGKNVTDLRTKANVAEWREDVKKLKEELSDLRFDSVKNVANSFDRLVDGIESVQSAFEKLDGDAGFLDHMQAILTLINEVIQMIDTYKSVFEGFRKTEEAYNKWKEAANAKEALGAAAQIAAQEAIAAAEADSAAATVAAETTKQTAIAATTTAHADEAIAGAAASQAGIPVAGPILAAAAVAGIVALFAANLKKFAHGGIVGGNSYSGDNQLIRANSSEMVLNRAQQAHLWNMINGKGSGAGGGQVEFKIRGADLIGTMNNYQSRMRG